MLHNARAFFGSKIAATDDDIGKVHDFLFDDHAWVVRYLVADTGNWLNERLVLISPSALGRPDWSARTFPVTLSRQEIEESPTIDQDAPVSRQHEIELARYYNWPAYWGPMIANTGQLAYPEPIVDPPSNPNNAPLLDQEQRSYEDAARGDQQLRSIREVDGYHIEARDGAIGHVSDFVIDESDWSVRYLSIDTRNWLPGKHVLASVSWIEGVSWEQHKVFLDLQKEAIETAPEFHGDTITHDYELALFDHYGRTGYWAGSDVEAGARR